MRQWYALAAGVVVLALAGCGGGGPPGPAVATPSLAQRLVPSGAAPASADAAPDSNELPVVVDAGPGLFWLTGQRMVNTLYAAVTVCTAGTDRCETIDHVAVDTGSVGLRLLRDALSGVASPQPVLDPATGAPLRECVQFADGYSWGSIARVDVTIGGRRIESLPVGVIGDAAAGAAPKSCVSGRARNTVAAFGANGVLGIGSFRHDCGANCAAQAIAGWYYLCGSAGSGAACKPAAVALDQQVPNPVARLDSDNNGVTVRLAAVPPGGAPSGGGVLLFGVGTRDNNALSDSARLFTVDSFGTLLTSHAGTSQRAIVDSGANGYFFASDLPACRRNQAFYCPAAGTAPQIASIVGRNGTAQTVVFAVDDLDAMPLMHAALPGVGAPLSGLVGGAETVFTWGLPFFFGRTVHVLLEGSTVGDITGPAIGF